MKSFLDEISRIFIISKEFYFVKKRKIAGRSFETVRLLESWFWVASSGWVSDLLIFYQRVTPTL